MTDLKILFMGTPDFAREILAGLVADGRRIVGAVTQPDKPKGRGYQLQPTPVKECALAAGIPVYQPETLKDGAFAETLAQLDPDLILVAAYGKILPSYVLAYPRLGCINAHASLLPKYRGAAPIQRAIMDGEKETGVTAMYMAAGLDTGDMILKETVAIGREDDFGTVHDKLAAAGLVAMRRVLALCDAGTALPREVQEESLSTYAAKITKEDGVLDFTLSAAVLHDRIRGLSPFPLCTCHTPDGKLLKIVSARLSDKTTDQPGGTVLSLAGGVIAVAAGGGVIEITGVLPEGKGRMEAAAFINGRRIAVGDVLQ